MEYNHILELIKTVSESNLTNFLYEEGNVKIHMSSGDVVMMAPGFESGAHASNCMGNQQAVVNTDVAVAGNASVSGGVVVGAESGSQMQEEIKKTVSTNAKTINSPLVGTFYAAPSEDAKPFVKVGDRVKKGQIVAIVEAMKLMNEIEAECDGVITEILVENATGVEYGEALFVVE